MEFSQILKSLINKTNTSNYKLAKSIGASPTTIANWLDGTSVPGIDKFEKIIEYFGISADYLLTGTDAAGIKLTDKEMDFIYVYRKMSEDKQELINDIINAEKSRNKQK